MRWSKALQSAVLWCIRRLVALEVAGSTPDLEAAPYVIAANHASHLDALVVLATLPGPARDRVVVAAAEDYFFSRPALGWLARHLANAMPMRRRGNPVIGLRQALEHLAAGRSVLLFPQGSRDREARAFKPGVGLLAARSGARVVPVAILGTERVLPKGTCLPRRGRVRIAVGQPMVVARDRPADEVAAEVQRAVERLESLGSGAMATLPCAAAL